jgi:hypothetical protein
MLEDVLTCYPRNIYTSAPSRGVANLTHGTLNTTAFQMPSIAESKRQVTEGLSADYEHDAILASLQDEIDKHNRETEEIRKERPHKRRRHRDDRDGESRSHRERHLRFRFKSGVEEPKPKKRSKRSHSPKPASPTPEVAHPFPREPTDPDAPSLPSNTAAFQTSLFDALADDEAASYWESVYSQPIHVYSRPVQQTESGELQDMDDETYAAYVQRKMWEKQNPEIVIERERMERLGIMLAVQEINAMERAKIDLRVARPKRTNQTTKSTLAHGWHISQRGMLSCQRSRMPSHHLPIKPSRPLSAYLGQRYRTGLPLGRTSKLSCGMRHLREATIRVQLGGCKHSKSNVCVGTRTKCSSVLPARSMKVR